MVNYPPSVNTFDGADNPLYTLLYERFLRRDQVG